jgi:hypothetical protein
MSYNPTIAWKASLTRIPPPIGASAPGSQFALNLKVMGVANDLRDTPCLICPAMDLIRLSCCGRRLFARAHACVVSGLESKRLKNRAESKLRITGIFLLTARKKVHKIFNVDGR